MGMGRSGKRQLRRTPLPMGSTRSAVRLIFGVLVLIGVLGAGELGVSDAAVVAAHRVGLPPAAHPVVSSSVGSSLSNAGTDSPQDNQGCGAGVVCVPDATINGNGTVDTTMSGVPTTASSCSGSGGIQLEGCLTTTNQAAVNPNPATPITVSDGFDRQDELAPSAWQYIEQEAEADVADVRGVANDRRNHFWSRAETDALMFVRLLNLIDEQQSSPQNLSSNDQAALTLLLSSYNSYTAAVANEALALYNQWMASPCNFKPPVGDPNAYLERELLYCSEAGFAYYTGQPAPPTADEFTAWASDVVEDDLRIQDIDKVGNTSGANGYSWIAGSNQHAQDLTLAKQYQDLVGSLQKGFQFLEAADNTASPLQEGQLTASEQDLSGRLTQASAEFSSDRIIDVAESSVSKLMNIDDILPDSLEFLDTGFYVGSAILGAGAVAAAEAYNVFNQYSVQSTLEGNVTQANDGGNLYSLANDGGNGMEELVNIFANEMTPTFDDRKYEDAAPDGPPPAPTSEEPQFTVTNSTIGQIISPTILAQGWLPGTAAEYSVDSSNWVRRAQTTSNVIVGTDNGVPNGEEFDDPYSDTTIDYVDPSGDWWEAWPTNFGLMQVRDAQQLAPASSIQIYPELTDGEPTSVPCSDAGFGIGGGLGIDPTYSGYECVFGTNTSFKSELQPGDFVQIDGDIRQVSKVYTDTAFDVTTPFSTLKNHPDPFQAGGPLMKLIGTDPNCWSDGNCQKGYQFQYIGMSGATFTAKLGGPPPVLSTLINGPLFQYTPQQCNDSCINGQAWTFQNGAGPVSLEALASDADPTLSITQVTWKVCAPNGSCTSTPTTAAPYLVSLPDGFVAGGEWTVSATAVDTDLPPKESTETTEIDVLTAPQTITPPADGTAHAGDVTTIAPTSSTGLPVVATSSTPLVCTTAGTNGTTVAFDAPGTCTIAFDQPGDSDYSPARGQMQFSVTPPVAVLTSDDPLMDDGDDFGRSVAISGDIMAVGSSGDTPAVAPLGSQHQGAVYVLQRPAGGSWSQAQVIAQLTASDDATGNSNAGLGSSVAIDGNTIVAGAPGTYVNGQGDQGAVYVFTEPVGGWSNETETAKLTASDGSKLDGLGSSVGISGATVLAGAPDAEVNGVVDQGAAYVFTEPVGGWSNETETAKLTDSGSAGSENLGSSVGISGGTIVAGVPGATVNGQAFQGAVYVYTEGSGWANEHQSAVLTGSDGTADAGLGSSLAIDGNTVVAGAPNAKPGGTAQGEAYAFTAPSGTFTTGTETARLIASDGMANDFFGYSVGISGPSVVIGAPLAHIEARHRPGRGVHLRYLGLE